MSIRQSLLRSGRFLKGRLHLLLGRAWLLIGRKGRARKEFKAVLECAGEDFSAYVQLGRLALQDGDVPGAIREMTAARRTNPERFAQLRNELATLLPPLAPLAAADGYTDERRSDGEPPVGASAGRRGPAFTDVHYESACSENEPFGAPSAEGVFDGPAPGNDVAAAGWFWYLDPCDQGGVDPANGAVWDAPQAADGERPSGEDAFPWPPPEDEFWMSFEEGDATPPDIDAWWRDGTELESEEPVLDEPTFDERAFEEEGNEAPSWAESPLASFYEELASPPDQEAEAHDAAAGASSDFSSEAEARKFRDLPPIHRSELDQVNWDDLSARLDEFE